MPKKLNNDTYEFKKGVVAKRLQTGKYKVVASKARVSSRRNPKKKTKKTRNLKKNMKKEQHKDTPKTQPKITSKKPVSKRKTRRSQKKNFELPVQSGGKLNGNNLVSDTNNLKLTVKMLRDFYEHNL